MSKPIDLVIDFILLEQQLRELVESDMNNPEKEGLREFLASLLEIGDDMGTRKNVLVNIKKG